MSVYHKAIQLPSHDACSFHILSRGGCSVQSRPLRCAAALDRFTVPRIAVTSSWQSQTPNLSSRLFADTSGACFVFTRPRGFLEEGGFTAPSSPPSFCFSAGSGESCLLQSADPPLPPDEDHLCAKVALSRAWQTPVPCNVS